MKRTAVYLAIAIAAISFAAPPRTKKKPLPPPPPPVNSAPLEDQITEIIDSRGADDAFWGIEIRDLKAGKTLYSLNAGHFFVPASNTKLFTTALALTRLGPAHRFHTRVVLSGPDLVLAGAGDPNLSGRTLPYQPDLPDPAPLAAINQLADEIVAHGIRHIPGDIIGDDSAFVYEPYPPGWSLSDTADEDGAPVSALCVDDNLARLQIVPALADGALVETQWLLPFDLFRIDNALLTESEGRHEMHFRRFPGSGELRLWGAVAPGRDVGPLVLAVDDPALFAARALKDALVKRGVACDGAAIARHQLPGDAPLDPLPGDLIAERVSVPLLDALRLVDKISENLHAEILLQDVALKLIGKGTREGGLAILTRFLQGAEIAPGDYHLSDGSGLSRYNLVTPHAIAALLGYMANSPLHDQWLSLLPVGGVDGSLRHRFRSLRLNGEILGKTGSLTHISALSGYAVRDDGSLIAFSILVNNFGVPSSTIRDLIDKIAVAIL